MSRPFYRNGYTLVELMVSLTISVIVIGTIFVLLTQSLWAWRDGSSWIYLTQQSRLAREIIRRGLDGKNGLLQATSGSVQITPGGASPDTLTFGVDTNLWATTTADDDHWYTLIVDGQQELYAQGTQNSTPLIKPDMRMASFRCTMTGRFVNVSYAITTRFGGRSFTNRESMSTLIMN